MKHLSALLGEALLVVSAGLALGWAGNALSPRGLRVDRDYFPSAPARAITSTDASTDANADAATPTPAPAQAPAPAQTPAAPDPAQSKAVERLHARGLVPIGFDEARATFEDPLCAAGAYLFLDARHDEDFRIGHIPGAHVFDHYHLERYLGDVMALAPGAMRMVVYCSGGDCEDSEFAAATLAGLLPDPSILRVYVGGITEWERNGMPVESGDSGSGEIRRPAGGDGR